MHKDETYRSCMSCQAAVNTADPSAIRLLQRGKVAAVLCFECSQATKSFKLAFTRASEKAEFTPLQFQCLDTFESDAYKQRLTDENAS